MLTPRRRLAVVHRAVRALSATGIASVVTLSAIAAVGQTVGGWSQFQGGAARTGSTSQAPGPGYGQAWFTAVAPAGPADRFGLAPPVVAGRVAIVVGPEQVTGIDVTSGGELLSVDRDLGPSVPAGVTPDGSTVVYSQGWGAGPPAVSPTDEAQPSPSPSSDEDGAVRY